MPESFCLRVVLCCCHRCSQVVKLHSPSESTQSVEIGRTEIISNSLDPKFVTIVPVVRAVYTEKTGAS